MTDGEKKSNFTATDVATLFAYEVFMTSLVNGRFCDLEEAIREASLVQFKVTSLQEKANE